MQLRACCTPSSVAMLRERRSRSQRSSPSRHTGRCAWLYMTCMSTFRCMAVVEKICSWHIMTLLCVEHERLLSLNEVHSFPGTADCRGMLP